MGVIVTMLPPFSMDMMGFADVINAVFETIDDKLCDDDALDNSVLRISYGFTRHM